MLDRINSVYAADAKFKVRASQDNAQVITLYKKFLHEPLSHESEHLLHTTWVDRSKDLAALKTKGLYPTPRMVSTIWPAASWRSSSTTRQDFSRTSFSRFSVYWRSCRRMSLEALDASRLGPRDGAWATADPFSIILSVG